MAKWFIFHVTSGAILLRGQGIHEYVLGSGESYETVSDDVFEDSRAVPNQWFDGSALTKSTDWDTSAITTELLVGDTYSIAAPSNSILLVNGVRVASPYSVPTVTAGNCTVSVRGHYYGDVSIRVSDNLSAKKAELLTKLNAVYAVQADTAKTAALGDVYCNEAALNKITAVLAAYARGDISTGTSYTWDMFDGSAAVHTYAQMQTLAGDIFSGYKARLDNKHSIQSSINSAANMTALLAIDLEAGWP